MLSSPLSFIDHQPFGRIAYLTPGLPKLPKEPQAGKDRNMVTRGITEPSQALGDLSTLNQSLYRGPYLGVLGLEVLVTLQVVTFRYLRELVGPFQYP